MRALLGLAATGLFLASVSVKAASLCNCCDTGVAESCKTVCASAKPALGQCIATLDYAGTTTVSTGDNPLYSILLRSITLDDAMRPQLEGFRKQLEIARRGLEKDRRASYRDFRKHKIDEATAMANTKRYEDAIVNYYFGLQAYRDRLVAVPKQ